MQKNFEFLRQMVPIKTNVEPEIKQLTDIKVVLFDIYGTMLISAAGDIFSTELHAKSVVSAFESVNIEFNENISIQDIGGIIIGEYMENILAVHDELKNEGIEYPEVDVVAVWEETIVELQETNVLKNVPQGLDHKNLALAFELKTNPVWPMPGLKNVVQKLSEINKPLGIVSNSQFFTPMIMNYFLENVDYVQDKNIAYFDPKLCVFSYKERMAKPAVLLFDKVVEILAQEYKIKPDQVVYVGNDMLNDVYCANKVGFKTALFAGDVRSLRLRLNNEKVGGLRPDVVLTELGQLMDVV